MLFSPSVSSTMTFDLAGWSRSRFTHIAMARTDGGAVLDRADLHALQVLLEPIVVERQRADEIRRAGKFHEADAVVGPVIDELRDDRFDDVDAV